MVPLLLRQRGDICCWVAWTPCPALQGQNARCGCHQLYWSRGPTTLFVDSAVDPTWEKLLRLCWWTVSGDDFNDVDVNEIESISGVKMLATAVWCERRCSGVILLTTVGMERNGDFIHRQLWFQTTVCLPSEWSDYVTSMKQYNKPGRRMIFQPKSTGSIYYYVGKTYATETMALQWRFPKVDLGGKKMVKNV